MYAPLPKTGELLAEGKTKKIWAADYDPSLVLIESKDDLTAGDGKKHDRIYGKAEIATTTTVNVFRLLAASGLPVAFLEQHRSRIFSARRCQMLPFEVVIRREAHGSYLKRSPWLAKGQSFPRLVVEFFLKTAGKHWGELELPCDDPLIIFDSKQASLYRPNLPLHSQEPIVSLTEFANGAQERDLIEHLARLTFLTLEKAWQLLGRKLVDLKLEFGRDVDDEILLADVIDNDSWRVLQDGAYIDKQLYRDGAPLDQVIGSYFHVMNLTSQFQIPKQQLVFWRGSDNDSLDFLYQELERLGLDDDLLPVREITCSVHKQPAAALLALQQAVSEVPDTVIVALVGRSNAAGPVLSTQSMAPVITVPADGEYFPADVWSSLRLPSRVPLMTVLSPANAVLAATKILAMRNPSLYSRVALATEEKLVNFVSF